VYRGFWLPGISYLLRKYARAGGGLACLAPGEGGGVCAARTAAPWAGAEHRFGNPHALRCIPIGIKRVSRLAVSRDNVRASPGRVRRRPEGRPSLILKSKAENFFGQFGEWPAIGKPIGGRLRLPYVQIARSVAGAVNGSCGGTLQFYESGLAERAIWLWVARNSASIADCVPSNRKAMAVSTFSRSS
jgi:hypothetical protein